MRVVFSRQALAELDDILGFITPNNPDGSARVHAQIRRAIERIGQYPEGAQQVAGREAVRRVPLVRYPYVIYYEAGAGEVTILRILHGARRQPWRGEDEGR